jgi:ribosomal protein S14
MKYLAIKDKENRINYKKFEKKKMLIKAIYVNKFMDNFYHKQIKLYFETIIFYKNKIKNYCVVTARARGILRKYNISRIVFKQYASYGYLKGIKKSSW